MNQVSSAGILSGKKLAAACQLILADMSSSFVRQLGRPASLAVVLVGDDPASLSYVTGKKRAAARIGIDSQLHHLPAQTSQSDLNSLVTALGNNDGVDGILVQSPLPSHLAEAQVTALIPPSKDVDCFHPLNVGSLSLGRPDFLPCTPHGVYRLLQAYGISTRGKHVVIAGRSNIVGKPLAQLLLDKQRGNATVTVVHSATSNLVEHTRNADILVAAIGQPELLRGDAIKRGAVVVDVGVNRIDDPSRTHGYRLVGDVHYEEAVSQASWLTPVPGGVGPMTITMLLYNTLKAASRLQEFPFIEPDWKQILE